MPPGPLADWAVGGCAISSSDFSAVEIGVRSVKPFVAALHVCTEYSVLYCTPHLGMYGHTYKHQKVPKNSGSRCGKKKRKKLIITQFNHYMPFRVLLTFRSKCRQQVIISIPAASGGWNLADLGIMVHSGTHSLILLPYVS